MFCKETLCINRCTICFAGHERNRKLESAQCGQPKAQKKYGNTTKLKCFLIYICTYILYIYGEIQLVAEI